MERDTPSATPSTTDPAAAFEWLTLDDGEEIRWTGKPHFYSILPALVIGIPLSLVLIGISLVVGAVLNRRNTDYVVTTEALYQKRGILSRDVRKIEFEKIQNISYSQGVVGNYAGYGDINVSTAGGSGVEMQFGAVTDPKGVQERINRQVQQARGGRTDSASEGKTDVLDDILAELRAIRTVLEADGQRFDDAPEDTDG